ncbi:MAG: ATP-binding protein [Acidimicrobiia bacterium]|nr:ATP-binding protein [Acidimicrobiia bacterium]
MTNPPAAEAALDVEELRRFTATFTRFMQEIHLLQPPDGGEARERVMAHLCVDPSDVAPVGQEMPPVDRPNLQLAMEHLMADDPDADCLGLSPELQHYPGFSFSALLAGRFRGPGDVIPPSYQEFPVGRERTLRCVTMGIWLIHHEGRPAVVCIEPQRQHEDKHPRLEVFAADEQTATVVLEEIKALRRRFNVYRGQVLAFRVNEYGQPAIAFWERPTTTADDVILADGVLASIERHAVEIGRRASQLVAAGQHLKRGLLLHGPPGTGKTHTVGYLMNAMPDRTTVVLEGYSVGALGYAAAIVRSLSPAMLVIEDIDIIATARGHYGEPGHPLLFNLLNEMDGLAATDDVLFVLTTNRADVLEPALAARPGRIDHSVEIALPGGPERRRLLDLYLSGTAHELTNVDAVVERTDGVTASFMKELVRRAVLVALERRGDGEGDGNCGVVITDDHLDTALGELLESASAVNRSLFGLGGSSGPGGPAP